MSGESVSSLRLSYPDTKREENRVDEYWGTKGHNKRTAKSYRNHCIAMVAFVASVE